MLMTMQRIVAIAVVVACAVLGGLSLLTRGDDTLDADVPTDPMVQVAAELRCDRQRFAFPTLDELDAFTATALAEKGVSVEAYAAFEDRLAGDAGLRAAVLESFVTICGE